MKKAFNKEVVRSITKGVSRFLALTIIVALGTGFYAGLRMTGPDMRIAADEYYDGTVFYDIRIVSTMGLTVDDVAVLEALDGVEAVMPAFQTDMVTLINGDQYTVRIHSLNIEAASSSEVGNGAQVISSDRDYLNRLLLVSGSWPTQSGECVISADRIMASPVSIGDTIEVIEGSEDVDTVLNTKTFTIVGFVMSPYYTASTMLGSTSLGSGAIQQYLYIPEEDFAEDLPFTEIFLTVERASEKASGSDDYKQLVDQVKEDILALSASRIDARHADIAQEAQDELDEARAEFEQERADALAELEDARKQLEDALATIEKNEAELADARVQWEDGVSQLAASRAEAKTGFREAYQELSAQQTSLEKGLAALNAGEPELQAAWEQWWQEGAVALAAAEEQLAALEAVAAEDESLVDPDELDQLRNAIAGMQEQEAYLNDQQATFDTNKAALASAGEQLAQAWNQYYSSKESTEAQLAQAQAELDDAATQIADGEQALKEGRVEYEEGLATYEENRAKAEQEFADAEAELADAQAEIDDIDIPEWYVMDRTQNEGAESYRMDAGRIDQIAQVFPFLFFLVAALVALTTMTRMVEEDRMLIGTHKALGYSRAKITSKYLIYAALASGIGSIIGILPLTQFLPYFIMTAYEAMYALPTIPTPIDPGIALLSFGLGTGITVATTWAAVTSTLREKPAALMLPRAPKAGKRILLERITPLWKRVSFSWKVTFRNIFRYKRRFFMTVIGIAGCTGLLLTGLGLHDSISDIIEKQYGEIYHYNTSIRIDDDISEEDQAQLDDMLSDDQLVHSSTRVFETTFKAIGSDEKEYSSYLIVPEDPASINEFITLRERVGHQELSLDDETVLLCEKLATKLEVNVGDAVTFYEVDEMGNITGSGNEFTVGGIVENYIGTFMFISPELYSQVMDEEVSFTTILANSTTDPAERQIISDTLLALDGVRTVGFNDESIESYQTMLNSVNAVVVILIIAAGLLAFVVLYNLTNININERQREIATLKVLGFVPREVDAYIFREIILLTIIGAFAGLALGVVMEAYVVITAEIDAVMFGRDIHLLSFVGAFVLTIVFSVIISLSMRKKLERINMVESLKSVE